MKKQLLKLILPLLLLLNSPVLEKEITASNRATGSMAFFEKLTCSVNDSTISLPPLNLLETALSGLELMKKNRLVARQDIITLIDFTLSANRERLWVIDLNQVRVLYHSLVSHGRNSGEENASRFSNKSGSFASSPGFYVTREPYDGKNGFSLAIDGIEKGINDNALKRGIVIHGANYVSYDFIRENGRLGRSQGCPAVPVNLNHEIIEAIKGGSCLFIYTNNNEYLTKSDIIKEILKNSGSQT